MNLRWIAFNLPIAYVFMDGTIGITNIHEYVANMIPTVSFILMVLSIALSITLFFANVFIDYFESEQLKGLREAVARKTSNVHMDVIFDLALLLLLSAHQFYLSSMFFFISIFFGLIGRLLRKQLKESLHELTP